jgi:hypothetical protein
MGEQEKKIAKRGRATQILPATFGENENAFASTNSPQYIFHACYIFVFNSLHPVIAAGRTISYTALSTNDRAVFFSDYANGIKSRRFYDRPEIGKQKRALARTSARFRGTTLIARRTFSP